MQQSAEMGAGLDRTLGARGIQQGRRADQSTFQRLMMALLVIMESKLSKNVLEMAPTEDGEPVEAFVPDCANEPFGMWTAIGALRWNGHALNAAGLEQGGLPL